MADTFTALLRLRQQTTGANNNTWGSLLNAAMFQLLEDSVAGRVEKVVAGVDITLSTNNGASDEARKAIISLSGSPGATRNIIIPNVSKAYIVENLTNATQNIKTSAGTALPISSGDRKIVLCNGADGVFSVADTLGGLDASAFAQLAARNAYTAGNRDVPRALVDGASINIDFATGNVFYVTLGGDRAVTFSNEGDGTWADVYFKQDATGGRDITSWPGTVVWENGVAPTFNGSPNTSNLVQLRYITALGVYFGRYGDTISATGGLTLLELDLDQNEVDVNVFRRVGSPAGAVTVTVRVRSGVLISSSDPATPALDLAGFTAASVLNIIVEGTVTGHGGKGGRGGSAGDANSANLFMSATNGTPGGDAIRLPSSACTINITNANGRIWGGGGGGGGGGPSHDGDGTDVGATGGGGGGGAGSGVPGDGGTHCGSKGNPGTYGGNDRGGTFGTGGTGQNTGGTGTAATGGNGGDWGAAGSNGTAVTTHTFDAPAGTGGAAGKAVNVNGGSAPSFVSGSGAPNVMGAVS